jgi:hypothetical protein
MTKKRIVENDKAKIEAVMVELDEKKNQARPLTDPHTRSRTRSSQASSQL